MIVISVAAAVITYIWITGYLGTTMAGIGQQTTQMEISIDSASNSSTTVTVVVRNVGDIAATVDKIYIGTSSSNLADAGTLTGTKSIAVSSTTSLSFTYASLKKSTTYIIKVVCTDGQSATGTLIT